MYLYLYIYVYYSKQEGTVLWLGTELTTRKKNSMNVRARVRMYVCVSILRQYLRYCTVTYSHDIILCIALSIDGRIGGKINDQPRVFFFP